jgi:hypothetical protein
MKNVPPMEENFVIKVNKIFYLFICAIVFLYTSILHAAVDIVVNENDSPDPIAAGGTLTYTLNVANNGPDDSTGVSLTSVTCNSKFAKCRFFAGDMYRYNNNYL